MSEILLPNGEKPQKLPKIKGYKMFGSKILIEVLTSQEILNTNLYVQPDAKIQEAPQGYILELGPDVPESWGLEVGQRVVIQGSFVALPNYNNHPRVRGVFEVSNIKAILVE